MEYSFKHIIFSHTLRWIDNFRTLIESIHGYDFFICYPRRGLASKYAQDLVENLELLPYDFRCFLDIKELEVGRSWKVNARRALRTSSKILLIVTPDTPQAKGVLDELKYNNTRGRNRRDIAPIVICKTFFSQHTSEDLLQSLLKVPQNQQFAKYLCRPNEPPEELVVISEESTLSESIQPSQNTLDEIQRDLDIVRVSARRSKFWSFAAGILSILLGISVVFGILFYIQLQTSQELSIDAKTRLADGLVFEGGERAAKSEWSASAAILSEAQMVYDDLGLARLPADFGMWELYQRVRYPRYSIKAHKGKVRDVAISAEGHIALSGGEDCIVKHWNLLSGQLLKTYTNHTGAVHSVGITWPGNLGISGGTDGKVFLFDLDNRLIMSTLHSGEAPITAVHVSAFGQYAAVATADGRVTVYKLPEQKVIDKFLAHDKGKIIRLQFSTDEKMLLSAAGTQIKRWKLPNCEFEDTTSTETLILDAAFFPEQPWAAAACLDSVRLWNLDSHKEIMVPVGHGFEPPFSVAIAPDGIMGASADTTGRLKLWSIRGDTVAEVLCHDSAVFGIGLAGSEEMYGSRKFAISGDKAGFVAFWSQDSPLKHHIEIPKESTAITLSPSGHLLASSTIRNFVQIWDVATGRMLRSLGPFETGIKSILFGIQDKHIVILTISEQVSILDMCSGQDIFSVQAGGNVTSVALGINESCVYIGMQDGTVLSNKRDNKFLENFRHTKPIRFLSSLEKDRLLIIDSEGNFMILDNGIIQKLQRPSIPNKQITFIALNRTSKSIIVGSNTGALDVYKIQQRSFERKASVQGMGAAIIAGCIANDGRTALIIDCDKRITLWDIEKGEYIRSVQLMGQHSPSFKTSITKAWISDSGSIVAIMEGRTIEVHDFGSASEMTELVQSQYSSNTTHRTHIKVREQARWQAIHKQWQSVHRIISQSTFKVGEDTNHQETLVWARACMMTGHLVDSVKAFRYLKSKSSIDYYYYDTLIASLESTINNDLKVNNIDDGK